MSAPPQNPLDVVKHKAHCKNGHAFTSENTYVTPAGVRQCVRCSRERSAQYREQRRAARVQGQAEIRQSAMQAKEWREVPGYPDYYVSVDGEVGSTKQGNWRVLSATGSPYLRVTLAVGPGLVSRRVHVLVAESFHGPRPDGLVVRHLNGVSTDNRPSNLAWGTQAENIADSVEHGTHVETRKTRCPQGHLYAGDNVRFTGAGTRVCLTCKRARENESRKAARRARGLKKSWTPRNREVS